MLFYGLYPLSRFLAVRRTEASKKDFPGALVNGTAVCDGGAVRAGQPVHSDPPAQQLASCTGSCGETGERMSTQREKETESGTDTEQCLTVLPHQTNQEQSKVTAVLEDLPKPPNDVNSSDQEVSIKDDDPLALENNTEGLSSTLTGTEKMLCEQFEQLQTKDTGETTVQFEIPSLKELLSSPKGRSEEATGPEQTPVQFVQDSTVMPSECWDEYIAETADMSKNNSETHPICFVPPAHSSQTTKMLLKAPGLTQPGYHFAVGPGLASEVKCPLWQLPTLSYYPTMETSLPFEVMWRVWENVEDSSSESTPSLVPFPFTKTMMNFTVMSYNILSQDLLEANQDLYTHCPLEVLEWSHRCRLLLEEIQRWVPDILCLQEVQENHFHQQLQPVLTQMGYTCVYKKRTGTKTDGCATCYRSSVFTELSVIEVEYFRPEIELLDRHNVGIIVLLLPTVTQGSEVKAQGPPLCVANTHLLFNPRRGDIKLAQLAILLAEIDKVFKSCKCKREHCNIILCGDFNSVPQSPLYELITKGELHYQGLPAWMISGQEDLSYKPYFYKLCAPLWPNTLGITEYCQFVSANQVFDSHKRKPGSRRYSHEFLLQLRFCTSSCERPTDLEMIPGVTDATPDCPKECSSSPRFRPVLRHRLDLQSVYGHVLPGSGNPEVTTLHSQVGATVDYIFYSPKHASNAVMLGEESFVSSGLKLTGCLSLLSEDVIWSMNGLPSHAFPSDHLSLLAKFQMEMMESP